VKRALGILLVAGGLLVAAVPRYVIPTCEFKGYPRMHCSDAARLWLYDGAVLAVLGALALALPGAAFVPAALAGIALAVGAIVVPSYTGYCASPRMPCNYGTVPAVRFLGGLLALAGAGFVAAHLYRRGREVT